jgi:N-acetylmuramoyl-L-alanine amidase
VLDPGHGGLDTGTVGLNGEPEKALVLEFALQLRDKLEKSGRYKVLMTRDTDSFVELNERRDFAERNKAALFIAIHADYANTSASGATIYSLRDSVADDLRRAARGSVRDKVLSGNELKTVRADAGDLGVIKGFLADLASREVEATKGRTDIFAQAVIDTMKESTSMKDNPHLSAAFRVLKTAQLPAVLIELAYVTNQQDALNLKSDIWRDKVTASIMTAIDNYFSNQISRLPM